MPRWTEEDLRRYYNRPEQKKAAQLNQFARTKRLRGMASGESLRNETKYLSPADVARISKSVQFMPKSQRDANVKNVLLPALERARAQEEMAGGELLTAAGTLGLGLGGGAGIGYLLGGAQDSGVRKRQLEETVQGDKISKAVSDLRNESEAAHRAKYGPDPTLPGGRGGVTVTTPQAEATNARVTARDRAIQSMKRNRRIGGKVGGAAGASVAAASSGASLLPAYLEKRQQRKLIEQLIEEMGGRAPRRKSRPPEEGEFLEQGSLSDLLFP